MKADTTNDVILIDEFDERTHRQNVGAYEQHKLISAFLKEQSDQEQRERLVEEFDRRCGMSFSQTYKEVKHMLDNP